MKQLFKIINGITHCLSVSCLVFRCNSGAIFFTNEIAPQLHLRFCAFLQILSMAGGHKKTCKRSKLQVL
jgi:hypothetical protein